MTNEQILRQAIGKAVKNGLDEKRGWGHPMFNMDGEMVEPDLNFIFSHDFLKAFFGESTQECVECLRTPEQPFTRDMASSQFTDRCRANKHSYRAISNWKDHARIMVLLEEPLQYLLKFLDNE